MFRVMLPILVLSLPLAACSFGAPPPSAAHEAIVAQCTKQVDATDAARDYAFLSQPGQSDTPFLGPPNPAYLYNRQAYLNDRNQRIKDCVRNYNPAYVGSGAGLPEPTIVGPGQ